jgi:hypothetical protein
MISNYQMNKLILYHLFDHFIIDPDHFYNKILIFRALQKSSENSFKQRKTAASIIDGEFKFKL